MLRPCALLLDLLFSLFFPPVARPLLRHVSSFALQKHFLSLDLAFLSNFSLALYILLSLFVYQVLVHPLAI